MNKDPFSASIEKIAYATNHLNATESLVKCRLMGEVYARMRIYGRHSSREIEALVDTGATFTKLPQKIANEIGIDLQYETEVELADSRLIKRKLGLAEIEIDSVRRPVLVSVSNGEEKPLIGYTTLENLGFKVNPVTHKLEPTRPIEY